LTGDALLIDGCGPTDVPEDLQRYCRQMRDSRQG